METEEEWSCVCVDTHFVYVHMYGGQWLTSDAFLNYFSTLVLRQSLPDLEAH